MIAARVRLLSSSVLVALLMQLGGGTGPARSVISAAAATIFGKTYVRTTSAPFSVITALETGS